MQSHVQTLEATLKIVNSLGKAAQPEWKLKVGEVLLPLIMQFAYNTNAFLGSNMGTAGTVGNLTGSLALLAEFNERFNLHWDLLMKQHVELAEMADRMQ